MKDARFGAVLAVLAFALLLVVGAPLMAMAKDDPTATGKVTAYEAGKSLSVQVGDDSKSYKINEETKVEGELAVGKEVQVWVKDGVGFRSTARIDYPDLPPGIKRYSPAPGGSNAGARLERFDYEPYV